jgi:sugar phosphate isomerase/epimerase
MITRRALIGSSLAAFAPAFAQTPRSIGVQLFSVRDLVLAHPEETVHAIAAMGYRDLEMIRSQVVPLAPYVKSARLRPVSLHFETPILTQNWDAWKHADMPPVDPHVTFDQVIALARDHGFEYLVFNYLTPEERLDLDFYRELADKLNVAADRCRGAGLRFCYHNHDFEFEPKTGGRPIDALLAHLDRNLVQLEVDIFWVSMAGVSAAEFIRENASRVEMLHLKDRAAGTPRHYEIATVPQSAYREVGNGDLPIPEILAAAAAAGIRYYFVEQDFSPDPLRSLRESYRYLRKIGF